MTHVGGRREQHYYRDLIESTSALYCIPCAVQHCGMRSNTTLTLFPNNCCATRVLPAASLE